MIGGTDMKRLFVVAGVILVLLFLMAVVLGCGSSDKSTTTAAPAGGTDTTAAMPPTTAAATHTPPAGARVLTFESMGAPQGMNLRAQEAFVNWVEVQSKGTLTVQFHYGDLCPAGEEMSAVKNGLCDMGYQYSLFSAGTVPGNEVTTLPWLSGYPGALQATLAHMELYQKYPELQAEAKGVKLLFIDHAAPTQIQTTKKPIKTLEDLKGLNQIEIGIAVSEAMKALGTVPLSFPPVENFDALSKGVADGISVNWDACKTFGYFDVIKYSTQASVANPGFFFAIMNEDTYNSLTDEQKAIFSDDNCMKMAKAFGYAYDMFDKEGRDMMSQKFKDAGLPEIYILPDEERNKWKEGSMSVIDSWIKTVTAAGLPGQALYDDAVKAFDKYKWTDALAAECLAIIEEWENAK
jgi:TRAP-type transport system periplasmic protein